MTPQLKTLLEEAKWFLSHLGDIDYPYWGEATREDLYLKITKTLDADQETKHIEAATL